MASGEHEVQRAAGLAAGNGGECALPHARLPAPCARRGHARERHGGQVVGQGHEAGQAVACALGGVAQHAVAIQPQARQQALGGQPAARRTGLGAEIERHVARLARAGIERDGDVAAARLGGQRGLPGARGAQREPGWRLQVQPAPRRLHAVQRPGALGAAGGGVDGDVQHAARHAQRVFGGIVDGARGLPRLGGADVRVERRDPALFPVRARLGGSGRQGRAPRRRAAGQHCGRHAEPDRAPHQK